MLNWCNNAFSQSVTCTITFLQRRMHLYHFHALLYGYTLRIWINEAVVHQPVLNFFKEKAERIKFLTITCESTNQSHLCTYKGCVCTHRYGFVFLDNSILMDSYRNHMNTSKIVVNAYRYTKWRQRGLIDIQNTKMLPQLGHPSLARMEEMG